MFRFTIRDVLWLMVVVGLGLFVGCPSDGFFGRYVFINSGKEPVLDFTIAVADGRQQTRPSTEPGQVWIVPNMGPGIKNLDVSWTAKSGETLKMEIDFANAAGKRFTGDLVIEMDEHQTLSWGLLTKP